eukprot:1028358-Pelagomonas_calceolata.AAC.1
MGCQDTVMAAPLSQPDKVRVSALAVTELLHQHYCKRHGATDPVVGQDVRLEYEGWQWLDSRKKVGKEHVNGERGLQGPTAVILKPHEGIQLHADPNSTGIELRNDRHLGNSA